MICAYQLFMGGEEHVKRKAHRIMQIIKNLNNIIRILYVSFSHRNVCSQLIARKYSIGNVGLLFIIIMMATSGLAHYI